MPKENRRTKMTKLLLNESFLHFLEKKPLARITIKEICEEADVNRSTYYAHFTDPYDQLKKLETEIMVDMSAYVDGIVTEGLHSTHKQKQLITGVLEYIQSKKHIFRVLLSNNGDLDLQRDILTFSASVSLILCISPVRKPRKKPISISTPVLAALA